MKENVSPPARFTGRRVFRLAETGKIVYSRILLAIAVVLDRPKMTIFSWTNHAIMEASRRGITPDDVRQVLDAPGQRLPVWTGREVWQSLMPEGSLLRVIIDVDRSPPEIVTVYRTSKISKYWRVIDEGDV